MKKTKHKSYLADLYHHDIDEHTTEGGKFGFLREAAFRGTKDDIERVSEIVDSKEYKQVNETIYELYLRPNTTKQINSVFDAIENVPNCKVALFFDSKWYSQTVGSQSGYPLISYAPLEPNYHDKEYEGDWWYGTVDPYKAHIGWDEMDYAGGEIEVKDGLLIRNGVLEGYQGDSENVVVPSDVSAISWIAFRGCKGLTSVTISDGVTRIDSCAFMYCRNLTSVTLPNGLTEIGEGAFCCCSSLTSITIPNSVTGIGACAFEKCKSLTSITLSNSLTEIRFKVFVDCSNITSVTIPDSVKFIDYYAFKNCKSLLNVSISKNVTSIRTGAFYGCKNLKSMRSPILINYEMVKQGNCFILLKTGEEGLSFYAFASKLNSDNLTDFAKSGTWSAYDQELINNGPKYRYTLPVRMIGALGRLLDPKELTEENRDRLSALISRNVKKVIPLAKSLNCPEIVQAVFDLGLVNKMNERFVRRQLEEHWR